MAKSYFGITDTGRMRDNNEDTFIAEPVLNEKYVAACVIDGVGGYEGGEVAASIAKDALIDYLKIPSGDIITTLREALSSANEKIYQEKISNGRYKDMACVLTLALVDQKNNAFYYAHIGDTRLYLLRDQSLIKVTKDHSFVGFLEDSGRLTEQDAMQHPKRNEINKALGFDATIPHLSDYIETGESPFLPGDILLLCSDGLTDMVNASTITSIISGQNGLQQKGEQLIMAANDAGGKDNITIVLVEHTAKPAKQKPARPAAPSKKNAVSIDEPPRVRQIEVNNELPVTQKKRNNAGLITFLAVLSFLLLSALIWMWWRQRSADSKTDVVPAIGNTRGQAIQNALQQSTGNTLILSDAGLPATISMPDTLNINNDSLHIQGTGHAFVKDNAAGNHAVIMLGPQVRFLLLDRVSLQDVIINVNASNIEALHFSNVSMNNSFIRLVQDFQFTDSLFTGVVSDMYMRGIDTLPKNR
jgi:serine/threonine protein phosphatase PrpC/cellobiose-specific phosphotransferase system component IIB